MIHGADSLFVGNSDCDMVVNTPASCVPTNAVKLGAGASGTVYRVRTPNGSDVVVKCVARATSGLFPDEAATLTCIPYHPNVVCYLGVANTEKEHQLYFECTPNSCTLSAMMRGDHEDIARMNGYIRTRTSHKIVGLCEYDAANILRQILCALAHCHQAGVAHRDIKPSNVLVSVPSSSKEEQRLGDTVHVQLIDFGLAHYFGNLDAPTPAVTHPGTIAWAAPELFFKKPYRSDKADIWSCGILLHTLLFSTLPFHGPTIEKTCEAIVADAPKLGRGVRKPSIACATLFDVILNKNPTARPGALELLDAMKSKGGLSRLQELFPPDPMQ